MENIAQHWLLPYLPYLCPTCPTSQNMARTQMGARYCHACPTCMGLPELLWHFSFLLSLDLGESGRTGRTVDRLAAAELPALPLPYLPYLERPRAIDRHTEPLEGYARALPLLAGAP